MTEPLGRVAVFWHYDSLPPLSIDDSPSAISRATHDTILNIRQVLYKFGIITSFRVYVGSMPPQIKWELQSHGVTVIECLWNASETMITADMFHFALDNPSLGATLVLISSSFTLAYTISVLGARRYRVALISVADPHNNVLLAQASELIDWRCLLSRGNVSHPQQSPSPPAMQNSSETSTPERLTEMPEFHNHPGSMTFLHNMAETLEHSFTINDLNLTGGDGERSASPSSHPNAVLELQLPPPTDNRPLSRQIEEAILTRPAAEDAEERLLNRSVSELALCGNAVGRPRANSLQDGRRLKSPSGNLNLEDPVALRSLPAPAIIPPSLGELASGKPLNVEAPPFIPPPGLESPPTKPSKDVTRTTSPPAPDSSPVMEPIEKTRPLTPHLEEGDLTSSISSTSSTVKPLVSVIAATKPGLPPKPGFTKAERRAVETVINVLLDMKSQGEARATPGGLPALLLVKDRSIYRGVGSRGNRFWRLINLGVQMGWLETGPGDAWIDIGMEWAGDVGS